MFPAIERLRVQLAQKVKSSLTVSTKRTQWAFSEDSEAWCDIDVREGDADRFLLVVVAGSSDVRNDFMAKVWHYYCPEVWIVDSETKTISVRVRDWPAQVAASLLIPTQIPNVTIEINVLFSED